MTECCRSQEIETEGVAGGVRHHRKASMHAHLHRSTPAPVQTRECGASFSRWFLQAGRVGAGGLPDAGCIVKPTVGMKAASVSLLPPTGHNPEASQCHGTSP